jgi:PAS domain S-box-containing protein
MRSGQPWSHRFFAWVLLAVLAVMLPLLALHVHTLYSQHRAAEDAVHRQVLARSADTAVVLDQTFARAETLLRLLARREELKSLDPGRCERVIEGLASLDPLYANVAVANMNGDVICASLNTSPRRPVRFSGPRWQAALAAPGLHLSKPVNAGPILGRPIAALTLPMQDANGKRIGMVGVSLDLAAMAERVLAPGLPPGGSMTLVDAESTVFTRYPDPGQWVGTQVPRSVRDARRGKPDGVVSAVGPDGVTRVYATTPLAVHGLRLASGIPSDVVLADAREANRRSVMVAVLTLTAALLLALYAARWLSAPLQSLVRSARAWAEGRDDTRADEALPGDFGTLAHEFNRMIDARVASEAQLRESERRYAEMLDGVDMLAITVDADGRLVYCNDALLRLTGWERDAVIGQSWARQFLPPDSPELRDFLQGQQAGATWPARSEGHVVTRSGERRLVRWSHAALVGPDGATFGRSSIGDDITERIELERTRQASLEAAAASQARTEFLTRISHELRTPLNAVLGFSQLLRERIGESLEPEQRTQLALVVSAGEQLRALIEDILDGSGALADAGRAAGPRAAPAEDRPPEAVAEALGRAEQRPQPTPRPSVEWLARVPPAAPAPPRAAMPPSEAGPQGRVLYIEDNEANALLVRELLVRWPGVELRVAVDGASGLHEAESWQPDLVLLDMQLPDMDGLRVLERLRLQAATRALRVVVLSASAMPPEVDKARRSGAIDYWTKPINFGPFLDGVRRLLDTTPA